MGRYVKRLAPKPGWLSQGAHVRIGAVIFNFYPTTPVRACVAKQGHRDGRSTTRAILLVEGQCSCDVIGMQESFDELREGV